MASHNFHRGIGYSITEVGSNAWEWAIFPPDSVKGFASRRGHVIGSKAIAIEAAKREIESQDGAN